MEDALLHIFPDTPAVYVVLFASVVIFFCGYGIGRLHAAMKKDTDG